MVPVQEILSFKVEGKAALAIVFQTTFTNTVTNVIAHVSHMKKLLLLTERKHILSCYIWVIYSLRNMIEHLCFLSYPCRSLVVYDSSFCREVWKTFQCLSTEVEETGGGFLYNNQKAGRRKGNGNAKNLPRESRNRQGHWCHWQNQGVVLRKV